MITCTIDGCVRDLDPGLKTWGQLLIFLESAGEDEPALVTAVRFRGVDQPSFREASTLSSDLQALGQIEIETASLRTLLASAAEAVLDGLDPLAAAARRTGELFRRCELAEANRRLAEFVSAFRALTELTALVNQLNTGDPSFDEESRSFLQRLHDALEALISSDMEEDWVSVADILQYDIAGMLPDWTALVEDAGRDAAEQVAVTVSAACRTPRDAATDTFTADGQVRRAS
jgi:hypothetical protein